MLNGKLLEKTVVDVTAQSEFKIFKCHLTLFAFHEFPAGKNKVCDVCHLAFVVLVM